jgi:polysaccharide pyruvyl transferase CsaB
MLISGGGSLLQDVTSARSALYYLGVLAAAALKGVPVAVIGQGVGPLRRPWIRWLAARCLRTARVISVRDEASAALLISLGIPGVHVGADLAFLVEKDDPAHPATGSTDPDAGGPRPLIGLAVRPWPGLRLEGILEAVRSFIHAHDAGAAALVFDRARDRDLAESVAAALNGVVIEPESPRDLLGQVGRLDLLVGMRLHALIFAAARAVPAVALSYDPKVDAFMRGAGLAGILPIGAASAVVRESLEQSWIRRKEIRTQLESSRRAWRDAAASGVALLAELLDAPKPR